MKLLLDQNSLQVCAHFGGHPMGEHIFANSRNKRLSKALEVASQIGYSEIIVSSGQPNQFENLDPSDVNTVAILNTPDKIMRQ